MRTRNFQELREKITADPVRADRLFKAEREAREEGVAYEQGLTDALRGHVPAADREMGGRNG